MAQGWRRDGAGMAQGWRRDGAGMAQGWRRDGAGMAQGWRSGENARLPPMCPGFDSRTRRHIWVEFVVGSRPCSERFFFGYSGFPSPQKPTFPNSNSIWNCQALYHEPLAQVIAQALPVFDIKFAFTLLQNLYIYKDL